MERYPRTIGDCGTTVTFLQTRKLKNIRKRGDHQPVLHLDGAEHGRGDYQCNIHTNGGRAARPHACDLYLEDDDFPL